MAGQNISHEGHRQRMRARVEQYGLESLAPHEALEYLLYITNARRDTNGIAHALLERFGSFAGVLEASEEELCRVPGVGPASARMLHLLPEVSRYYEHSRTSTEGALTTTERLAAYLKPRFAGAKQEKALLLSLDSRSRVKSVYWLKEGNARMVSLEVKDVVSAEIRPSNLALSGSMCALSSRADWFTGKGSVSALFAPMVPTKRANMAPWPRRSGAMPTNPSACAVNRTRPISRSPRVIRRWAASSDRRKAC